MGYVFRETLGKSLEAGPDKSLGKENNLYDDHVTVDY